MLGIAGSRTLERRRLVDSDMVQVSPRSRSLVTEAHMRCYFMLDGQIHNVEMLRDGPDEDLIEPASFHLLTLRMPVVVPPGGKARSLSAPFQL
jgi:hypothetical protein